MGPAAARRTAAGPMAGFVAAVAKKPRVTKRLRLSPAASNMLATGATACARSLAETTAASFDRGRLAMPTLVPSRRAEVR